MRECTDIAYRVLYFGKDGSGFCGGNEPWILDEFDTIDEAMNERARLSYEGFQSAHIKEVLKEDVDVMRTGGEV